MIRATDVRKAALAKIDEMPAGEELDRFIVREAFQLDVEAPDLIARYSQRDSFALAVLKEINNEFGADITIMPDGRTEVTLRWQPANWDPEHFAPSVRIVGRGDTFALAVCRAAAKMALMEKWQGEEFDG